MAGLSRFEAAEGMIRPVVHTLGETKEVAWNAHLAITETAERQLPQLDAATAVRNDFVRDQGLRLDTEFALRELRRHLRTINNETVLLQELPVPMISLAASTATPAAAMVPTAGNPVTVTASTMVPASVHREGGALATGGAVC